MMNDFSLVCRVLGTLFYRQPQDALVQPLMQLIGSGKLADHWPLKQDALLARLQKSASQDALADDYQLLLTGAAPKVAPVRSAWLADHDPEEVGEFLQQRGMPAGTGPVDHFGALLLAASWLEDQATEDETDAQRQLFDRFLLTWSDSFLAAVEVQAGTDFYRAVAIMCREALLEMRTELDETPAK